MFSRKITVRPSEVSMDGKLKLRSLLNYFQDTAGIAVEGIEGTTTELLRRGYAWVLSKYEIDFFGELPSLDDEITLSTYHDPSHGYNTLRMFHVIKNDTEIIRAKSSWFLVDIKAGKPVKALSRLPEISTGDTAPISPEFLEIPEISRPRGEENLPPLIRGGAERSEAEGLKIEAEGFSTKKIPVTWNSLDYNGHVNNAVYFDWISDEFCDVKLRKICASFRSGAKLNEVITLEAERVGGAVIMSVKREGIKKPSANFMILEA